MSVGLHKVSRCPFSCWPNADAHVGEDSARGALHDGHLSRLGAFAQRLLLFVARLGLSRDLEHLDAIAHLLPPDTRDAIRGKLVRCVVQVSIGATDLTTPALATLAKGTSLPSSCLAAGETLSRGTSRVSETANATDVNVAAA